SGQLLNLLRRKRLVFHCDSSRLAERTRQRGVAAADGVHRTQRRFGHVGRKLHASQCRRKCGRPTLPIEKGAKHWPGIILRLRFSERNGSILRRGVHIETGKSGNRRGRDRQGLVCTGNRLDRAATGSAVARERFESCTPRGERSVSCENKRLQRIEKLWNAPKAGQPDRPLANRRLIRFEKLRKTRQVTFWCQLAVGGRVDQTLEGGGGCSAFPTVFFRNLFEQVREVRRIAAPADHLDDRREPFIRQLAAAEQSHQRVACSLGEDGAGDRHENGARDQRSYRKGHIKSQ